jgi:hypothetical protein
VAVGGAGVVVANSGVGVSGTGVSDGGTVGTSVGTPSVEVTAGGIVALGEGVSVAVGVAVGVSVGREITGVNVGRKVDNGVGLAGSPNTSRAAPGTLRTSQTLPSPATRRHAIRNTTPPMIHHLLVTIRCDLLPARHSAQACRPLPGTGLNCTVADYTTGPPAGQPSDPRRSSDYRRTHIALGALQGAPRPNLSAKDPGDESHSD